MYLLNYIYFLILSYYEWKFLKSTGREVSNPLGSDTVLHFDGKEMFWCLLFSTGVMAFSAPGGLDLMALRLLVLEAFCISAIFISPFKTVWSLSLKLYLVYLIWLLIGCFYSPSIGYGIRTILKYVYPFLLCLCASSIVRNSEVFLKSCLWARWVALASIIVAFIPGLNYIFPGVFWYGTARSINFISMMVLSLGLFYFTDNKKKNLVYAIIFLIPCFIWVFRTSIMGSLVAIMAFYFIKDRFKALPKIIGVLILGVLAVFFIPTLHEKMFKDTSTSIEQFQQGELSMQNVETNARQAAWEYCEKKFYEGHEIKGSGTGALQHMFYTTVVFPGLKIAHSDFVQMKCDNGLIGLYLYCIMAFLMFFHCFKTYQSSENPTLRLCALISGASIAGIFVTLYSENTVNYSMATLSMPFGFYGMMLGLIKAEETDDIYSYTPIQQG